MALLSAIQLIFFIWFPFQLLFKLGNGNFMKFSNFFFIFKTLRHKYMYFTAPHRSTRHEEKKGKTEYIRILEKIYRENQD